MPSSALPLNLPADFAVVTRPETLAPFGMTPRPSMMMGSARDAATRAPASVFLELTDWSTVMLSAVPAGTTTGGASSCLGAACSAAALFAAPGLLLVCEELHPHEATRPITQIHGERLARRIYVLSSVTFGRYLRG